MQSQNEREGVKAKAGTRNEDHSRDQDHIPLYKGEGQSREEKSGSTSEGVEGEFSRVEVRG